MDYKEKVIALLNDQELSKEQKEKLENIFPELEESKDESIRKLLINFLKSPFVNENITDEKVTPWIAWLEKQGEQKPTLPKWKYKKDNIPLLKDSLILNKYGCVAKSPSGAIVSDVWVLDYDELAKLPKEELEEQGEKKPTDKITPKFKVGDWITNGDYIWKIVEVASLDYILQSQDGDIVDDTISYVDEQFHSFTIEDAKDGDVLINWNNTTFIFKAIEDKTVKFHIAYNENWDTIKTPSIELSHLGLPEPQFEFRPAFKEQRDLLFQKMKEAGYEWESEKKELKKIEPKNPIVNVPPRELILSIWYLGNEWKELTNGCILPEYGTQLDYIQKHWYESEYYLKATQGNKSTEDVK